MIVCQNCHRHVRPGAGTCAFCKESLQGALPLPGAFSGRSSRAAMLFGAAAVVVACGGQVDSGSSSGGGGADAAADGFAPVPAYGAPTIDAGPDVESTIPMYGAPAIDASTVDAEATDTDRGAVALYGAPAP